LFLIEQVGTKKNLSKSGSSVDFFLFFYFLESCFQQCLKINKLGPIWKKSPDYRQQKTVLDITLKHYVIKKDEKAIAFFFMFFFRDMFT
jgi:hypothetical protein